MNAEERRAVMLCSAGGDNTVLAVKRRRFIGLMDDRKVINGRWMEPRGSILRMTIRVFHRYAHPTLLPCNGLKLVTAAENGGYCRLAGETEVKVTFSCARVTTYHGELEEYFHAFLASVVDGMIDRSNAPAVLPQGKNSVRIE